MQRSQVLAKSFARKFLPPSHPSHPHNQIIRSIPRPCDVFINHRGIDTKRTISGLLYYHLSMLRLKPFLDSENMKPGEKLFDKIDTAIRNCKLGIAVFSPRYCESYFCLHELALLMESKKRVIPIFCDVKPSQLQVYDDGTRPESELRQYSRALEEAKYTVGLTFDTSSGCISVSSSSSFFFFFAVFIRFFHMFCRR
jgi:hypothetical protein